MQDVSDKLVYKCVLFSQKGFEALCEMFLTSVFLNVT